MFGARPSLGSGASSFGGFGSSTTSTAGFGASTFGRPPSFGTPQTTASSSPFGANTATGSSSLFGQNQTSGGLFGTTSNTSFGSTSGFGTSGGGLFGSTSTPASTTGGLFGTTTSAGFNASQSQTRPFSFGTPTTSAPSNTGALFGGSLFGSSVGQQQPQGTTIKYNPLTGSDTMTRGGVSQNIQTKIEVISAMKEYESKSLEELRFEDYSVGRKGTGQGSGSFGFVQNKFMGQQQQQQQQSNNKGWMTDTSQSGGLFGQKAAENKSLFGTNTSTGFGTSTSGNLFGQTSTSPFGQVTAAPSTGFSFGGQAKPAAGFSFGQPTTSASVFGQPATSTQSGSAFGSTGFNFGAQANPLFGSTQNKPVFGATNTSTNLFGSKTAGNTFGGFGTPSSASPFGTTNTNTGSGLFGNPSKPSGGFALGTSTPAFGTSTTGFGTGGGLFGSTSTANKPGGGLSFGSTNAFGTNTAAGGFGFNQPTGGGLFGSTGTTGGGLFGNTSSNLSSGSTFGTLGSGFGSNPLQTNNNLTTMNASIVSNNNISNLIKALTHNPFGTSSLLKSAAASTGKADELLNASTTYTSNNANDPNKLSTSKRPTYVLPSGIGSSPKPRPIGKMGTGFSDFDASKSMLFAGLEDKNDTFSEDPFKPKFPSVKKLNLKVFKNIKSGIISQCTMNGSVVNEHSVLSPLTTPISSCETPSRQSISPSQGTSPTPDIIKGRDNMKKLHIPNKNHLNDTYAELGMANSDHDKSKPIEAIVETDKDTSISLFEASSIEDMSQAANTSLTPHPAGIKLTRSGYYSIPSMVNLGEMVDEDGVCLVENFTVGRYGYGNICFQGITNVSNLDIDSFVFIVRKEVEVYPEGVEKPKVGDGLNKLAYVTLDCVWPVDKTTRDVIKSEERLVALRWTEYLEQQCIKMEATFVEYRSETGSWVFKVNHFSKYGLQNENNDEPLTAVVIEATAKENVPPPALPVEHLLSPILPPPKSSLPMPSYAGLPLPFQNIHNKGNQGPPALGLTSPPNSFLRQETIASEGNREVPAASGYSLPIYLDGTSVDMDDNDDENDEDDVLMCPLSPSTERLTITTMAPPRAIQTLKSQLFPEDIDNNELSFHKGEKRDSTELRQIVDQSSIFALKGFSKKLLMEPDDSIELIPSEHEVPLSPLRESDHSTNKTTKGVEVPPQLRDAKTEYHLLPSDQKHDSEFARYQTQHLSSSVPIRSGLAFAARSCISDSAASMSRSFRVGWGPRWTLTHAGTCLGESHNEVPADEEDSPNPYLYLGSVGPSKKIDSEIRKVCQRRSVFKEKLHLSSAIEPSNPSNMLGSCLQNALDSCAEPEYVEEERLYCPYFYPKKDTDVLHRLTNTAIQIEDSESKDRKMSTIFELCVALWGKLSFYSPLLDGDSEYARAKARKEALSQWLEEVSEAAVTEETERALAIEESESYLDAIFSHLTARQISEACNLAQDKSDHHLALLLSQACLGEETPRQIMSQQLTNWAWAEIDSFISIPRLVLFSLISGKATHDASHTKINTCAGLDWRRALALHLWYVCPTTATIAEALQLYERASGLKTSDKTVYCQEPKPMYLMNQPLPQNIKVNNDVCFQLLKLYVDPSHSLESLLETSSITPDPMDVSTSWLLWWILQSLGYDHLSSTKRESLNTSMVALLEAQDMWHWAAFVILSSPNEHVRREALSELLNRHVLVEGEEGKNCPFYTESEHFLLQYLKLPEQWLYRAKAIRAKSLNMIDEEAWYLLQSGQYNEAHKLIVDSIAPNAVINEDHDHLLSFLDQFSDDEVQSRVTDWLSGGGIYKNYLDVIHQVEEMKKSRQPTGVKIERLRPKLLALCTRLNNVKCPTAVHRLCVSEMSRVVVSVLRAILADEPEGIRVLAQQIAVLPLAHECALEELNLITHQYLTQVSMDS